MAKRTPKTLPLRHQDVFDDSIYSEYDLQELTAEQLARFFRGEGAVDSFCVECERSSVFSIPGEGYFWTEESKKLERYGVLTIKAKCGRQTDSGNCGGQLIVCFLRDGDRLVKIGQYPSRGDLDQRSLDPTFSKELDEPLRRELGRAIGLRAHGIGVGSFIYLRRVLENLIEESHNTARQDEGWDEERYRNSRVVERIQLLRSYLPTRLVEMNSLYGILSKAVHELGEEECLDHFDLVQRAIYLILRERGDDREHARILRDLQQRGEMLRSK